MRNGGERKEQEYKLIKSRERGRGRGKEIRVRKLQNKIALENDAEF